MVSFPIDLRLHLQLQLMGAAIKEEIAERNRRKTAMAFRVLPHLFRFTLSRPDVQPNAPTVWRDVVIYVEAQSFRAAMTRLSERFGPDCAVTGMTREVAEVIHEGDGRG